MSHQHSHCPFTPVPGRGGQAGQPHDEVEEPLPACNERATQTTASSTSRAVPAGESSPARSGGEHARVVEQDRATVREEDGDRATRVDSLGTGRRSAATASEVGSDEG